MPQYYPYSLYCRFEEFPARTRYTCGRAFDALPLCPYSYGSRVECRQTPLSGAIQGELVQGGDLPRYEIIYSDTGLDEEFGLKVSSYGHGMFYIADLNTDDYQTLAVIKGIRVEAAGLRKAFETMDVWETRIPLDAALVKIPQELDVAWREDAAFGRFSAVWYAGDAPEGEEVLRVDMQLAGPAYIGIHGGES